jgi:hypothetical protein
MKKKITVNVNLFTHFKRSSKTAIERMTETVITNEINQSSIMIMNSFNILLFK